MTFQNKFFVLLLVHYAVNAATDPTRPAWIESSAPTNTSTPKKINEPIILAGILFSKDRQVVMLNNRFYRVGDTLGRQTISKIERDRIWLRRTHQDEDSTSDMVLFLPHIADLHKSQKAAAHE